MSTHYTEVELTDQEMDEYLSVALANGFSKGTANVSPADMKKLRPLLNKYRKSPHPFRACVKDNRKRFGPATEKFCAVIKDLIEGTTHWRGKKKGMSEATMQELFGLDVDDTFFHLLVELSEDEINEMVNLCDDGVDLSDDDQLMAEVYFDSEPVSSPDSDGLIWKTILREGVWKISPGSNAKESKPLTVVRDGQSSGDKLIISMSELKENFEKGAIEHVTIPTSHKDSVTENTGYVRKLRIGQDEQGRSILEAGMDFTDPEVKRKVQEGSIANTSSGVLFGYQHKETGDKFNSVLAHAALTNRPWITGMKPFGVQASEDLNIVGFAEEINDDPADAGGGEEMSETTFDLSELGFASAEELKAALSETNRLRAKEREREVEDRCKKWQESGKAPALVAEAKAMMMADDGSTVLNLSEDGKENKLTATDIVERLVEKSNSVKLDEDPVNDKDASDESPETEITELSHAEKVLATQLYLEQNLTHEEAVAEAKRRIASGEGK